MAKMSSGASQAARPGAGPGTSGTATPRPPRPGNPRARADHHAGAALAVLPSTVVATDGVPPAEAGLASGLQNMSRQVGGALGLAIMVTIATTAAGHHGGATLAAVTVHGYHVALLVAAGVSAITAASAAVTLRQPPR